MAGDGEDVKVREKITEFMFMFDSNSKQKSKFKNKINIFSFYALNWVLLGWR